MFCLRLVSGSPSIFWTFLQAKSDVEEHNGRLQQQVLLLEKKLKQGFHDQLSSFDQQMICMHDSPPASTRGNPARNALSAITNTTGAATAQSKWADRPSVKPAATGDITDLKETPAATANTMSLKENHRPAQPAMKYMSSQDIPAAVAAARAGYELAATSPVIRRARMKTHSVLTSLTVPAQPAQSGATDLNSYSCLTISPSISTAVFPLSGIMMTDPLTTAQSAISAQAPKTTVSSGAATALADSASPSPQTQTCAGFTAEDWGVWGSPVPNESQIQDSGFSSRKHAVLSHGCFLNSSALQNGKSCSEQQCVSESDFAMSGQGTPEAAFSPGTHTVGAADSLLPGVEMKSSGAAATTKCVSTPVLPYPMSHRPNH